MWPLSAQIRPIAERREAIPDDGDHDSGVDQQQQPLYLADAYGPAANEGAEDEIRALVPIHQAVNSRGGDTSSKFQGNDAYIMSRTVWQVDASMDIFSLLSFRNHDSNDDALGRIG